MKRKRRKNKTTLQITNNSKEYRNAKRLLEAKGCPICPHNRGCNRNRDYDNNWKQHRQTQWRD